MKGTVYTLHAHGVRQQAARGGRVRRLTLLGRFVLTIIMAFVLICQPYSFSIEGCQIKAHKQYAQATPVAVPYALAFIQACAEMAGAASVSEWMTTIGILIAADTGYNIFRDEINLAADNTNEALDNLLESAEWPAWEELQDSDKEAWGNKQNYEAAHFNSYLDAFGLADERNAFETGGSWSGGGDIDADSKSRIERIGDIGRKWASGISVPVIDLNGLMPDITQNDYSRQLISTKLITAEETDVPWPSVVSNPIAVNAGFYFVANEGKYIWACSQYVNGIFWGSNNTKLSGVLFSKVPFTVHRTASTTQKDFEADEVTINDRTFYKYTFSLLNEYKWLNQANVAFAGTYNSSIRETEKLNISYKLLFENDVKPVMDGWPGGNPGEVSYPEQYIQADELTPDTTWPSLFTDNAPSIPTPNPGYPESDFNPNVGDDGGDYVPETSTPEWQEKTQDEIFTPALNLPFDEMFPFCVIWDISKLMNKLYELGGYQAVSADQSTSLRGLYDKREGLQVQADVASKGGTQLNAWSKPGWTVGHTEFVLPVSSFGVNGMYDLELDVWPLAVLLAWLKPFFQLAFIAGLLYVTIVTFRMFIFTD